MGLLSAKSLVQIGKGVATGVLGTLQDARATSELNLQELKKARDEVNDESQKIGTNYDKALRVASATGNSAFANYLFSKMSLDNLASLGDLAPTTKDEQLKQLKFEFESLDPNIKATYDEGSYSETAKSKYNKDLDDLKIKKGLVYNGNMGNNTVESLITTGVRKKEKVEAEKIMGQVVTPEVTPPAVEEFAGAYGKIGESAFEDSRLKLMIDQDYIDGTLEQIVRNRLMMQNVFNPEPKEVEQLVNKEYNSQITNAKKVFMTSGGDTLLPTDKTEITNDNINQILETSTT